MSLLINDTTAQIAGDKIVLRMFLMRDNALQVLYIKPLPDLKPAILQQCCLWLEARDPVVTMLKCSKVNIITAKNLTRFYSQIEYALTKQGISLNVIGAYEAVSDAQLYANLSLLAGVCIYRTERIHRSFKVSRAIDTALYSKNAQFFNAASDPQMSYYGYFFPKISFFEHLVFNALPSEGADSIELCVIGPVAVQQSHSCRKLGYHLVQQCVKECERSGCDAIACISTNHFLSKILQKLGFLLVYELPFSDYMTPDKTEVLPVEAIYPHLTVQCYVLIFRERSNGKAE